MLDAPQSVQHLSAKELRELTAQLIGQIASHDQQIAEREQTIAAKDREIHYRQAKIDKLTYEIAQLKRHKFDKRSEHLHAGQVSLLDEAIDADLAAIEAELEQLAPGPKTDADAPKKPKRAALPADLPRVEHHHELDSTTCTTPGCGCALKRIGEDVSEKLDYVPGVFTVQRHIRGKWACAKCQRLSQAPVPAQIIDKGIATSGLLAQVLVAKYADHLPLYRQENIFARAGMALPRSTLAQWVGVCGVRLQPLVDALKDDVLSHSVVHADETPVAMLAPGKKKTHRAYLWAYAAGAFEDLKAVVYDFCPSRASEHPLSFLKVGDTGWRGQLVCDDYAAYKVLFTQGVVEVGCMAHARRKFFELHVNHKSLIAEAALKFFVLLYEIEREIRSQSADQRRQIRQQRAKPVADALHVWLKGNRLQVPDGSATAKTIDYSLKRWIALTRYLDDGQLPIDNNWIENQIRPIAVGRGNWLFAGSLRAGQRAAAIMSLIQSARLNGHDPYAYLKDVLLRLPTHPASRIGELLPHRWQPVITSV